MASLRDQIKAIIDFRTPNPASDFFQLIDSYALTPAESAANVTPVNFSYPPLYPERYRANTIPGTTSMASGFQFAINVAKANGGTIYVGAGPYLIDQPLDLTFPASAISGITQAASAVVTLTIASAANPFYIGQVVSFAAVVGMVQINGLSAAVTAIGGSSGAWTITVAINSAPFTAYASGGRASSQNCNFSIIGYGRGKAVTFTQGVSQTPSMIFKHTGIALDCTGNLGVHFENLSICTDAVVYPQVCFLLARNLDGGSRSDRFLNCYVAGYFSKTILYNFGAEDGMYSGCQFYNFAPDSNTSVFDITEFNIRAITSSFTAIQSVTPVSTLDHKIFGGEFGNLFQGSGATADVFRFEGARQIKIYGPWMDSASKGGGTSGRALIYLDGTNAPTQGLFLHGIDGEAGAPPALYGILISNNVQTHANFIVEGCWFPTVTSMLGGGVGATLVSLTWINSVQAGGSGGITFGGTLIGPFLDGSSGAVVAASIDTFANSFYKSAILQNNGEADLHFRDFSQASGSQWKKIRNTGGGLVISACDDVGGTTANSIQFNTNGTTQMLGKLYPVQETLATQTTAGLYGGTGVPNNAFGSNGDFYFRGDTPATAGARLYIKSAGAWVATAL